MEVTFLTNEDKAVLDEQIDALSDQIAGLNGGSSVAVDVTLTQSGMAADAKATGDAINSLSEENTNQSVAIAATLTEFAKIKTFTATTDMRSDFADLPDGAKTLNIYSDGVFGDTAYISTSEDFVPRGGFDRAMPYHGVIVASKGRGWTIKGTTINSATLHFVDNSGESYVAVPSGLAGTNLSALIFAKKQVSASVAVSFHDTDKTQIGKRSMTPRTQVYDVQIPEGTAYIRAYIYMPKGNTYDDEIQFYLVYPDQINAVVLTGEVTLAETTVNNFSILPYKSTVSFDVPLKDYIDNFAGGGTVGYLTPEDFGAMGDGSNDDGEAIAACIQAAAKSGQAVIMAKSYYVSQPIVITQTGLNISANTIVYSGNECALKIVGRENVITIQSITSSGVGIGIYADQIKSTSYNFIDVNVISSQSHGIVFYSGSTYAHQNTIRFSLIKAGGAGCYGIAFDYARNESGGSFIAECNLYGGQIANCEWAVYKVSGNSRCYGFEIEENVQGGFYTNEDGGLVIFHPRHAESSRDGAHAFLKYTGTRNTFVYLSSPLPINEIDLTDAIDTYTSAGGDYPLYEGRLGVIYGQITDPIPEVGTNAFSAQIYARETCIWGKNLIFKPHMDYRCEVTTDVLDTRIIGTSTEYSSIYLTQLPTLFVVDSCNTTINLHASYCAFGITEFSVKQSGGFSAQVTDHLGNVIFDGAQLGDGVYKLKAWKDKTKCGAISSHLLRVDLGGQVWTVEPVLSAESYRALMGLVAATN